MVFLGRDALPGKVGRKEHTRHEDKLQGILGAKQEQREQELEVGAGRAGS